MTERTTLTIPPNSRRLPRFPSRHKLTQPLLRRRRRDRLHRHLHPRPDTVHRHHGSVEDAPRLQMVHVVSARRECVGGGSGVYGGVSAVGDWVH